MPTPDVERLIRHATLRQLQIFETVARLESFSRAGERLFLTQPTVSMQVKKLAETLGGPLFEQVGKRLFLTETGRVALGMCEGVFDALRNCQMTLADMAGLKQGRLRLSVVTTAEYFAPRALGAFAERYPGVDLELLVLNRGQILERLNANLDDLSILGQPPEELDVEATPFLANPQVVIAPRRHPLARVGNIPFARLAEEFMILREAGSGTRKAVERIFAERGERPRIRMELGGNEAIKQAVAGGLGLAIVSRHVLSMTGKDSPLTELDVEGFPIERHWRLVRPRGKEPSPVARAFHAFLLDEGPGLMSAEIIDGG